MRLMKQGKVVERQRRKATGLKHHLYDVMTLGYHKGSVYTSKGKEEVGP